jgi:hypothetical protein
LEIRYTPENESNENLMQGLMNRHQATARLMRESHHAAVPRRIIRPDLYVVRGVTPPMVKYCTLSEFL